MKILIYILIVVSFSQMAKGQININNISLISITDKININYEKTNSYTFEIKFKDSIELWNTKQISRAEFQQEIFKQQTDSIYSGLWFKMSKEQDRENRKQILESLREHSKQKRKIFENAYLTYCDTVKAKFIKTIPKNIIVNLLMGLQDSTYNENTFKNQVKLDDNVSYGNSIRVTNYYPLVGMTIYSSTKDTLVVYNNGQQDLMIPWTNKSNDTELYNPIIIWSLDAILPEKFNYNKNRLIKGMKK